MKPLSHPRAGLCSQWLRSTVCPLELVNPGQSRAVCFWPTASFSKETSKKSIKPSLLGEPPVNTLCKPSNALMQVAFCGTAWTFEVAQVVEIFQGFTRPRQRFAVTAQAVFVVF